MDRGVCRMSLFYCIPPPYPLTGLLALSLSLSVSAWPAKFQVLWREFELTKGQSRP